MTIASASITIRRFEADYRRIRSRAKTVQLVRRRFLPPPSC